MSYTLNSVTLLGKLGRDAETSFLASGTAVTKFSIATDRSWKDKASGEWKKETDWHNVVMWGNEKLAAMLTKGAQACVQGRLQTRSYEKDSRKIYVTEVVADNVILCGGKGETSAPRAARQEPITDLDVPF